MIYSEKDISYSNAEYARADSRCWDFFISHSSKDYKEAEQIADLLAKESLDQTIYLDRRDNLVDGDKPGLENYLSKVIAKSKTLVLLASENSKGSWWVGWELGIAYSEKLLRAVFLINGYSGQDLPNFLQENSVPFNSFHLGVSHMLNKIRSLQPSPSYSPETLVFRFSLDAASEKEGN